MEVGRDRTEVPLYSSEPPDSDRPRDRKYTGPQIKRFGSAPDTTHQTRPMVWVGIRFGPQPTGVTVRVPEVSREQLTSSPQTPW